MYVIEPHLVQLLECKWAYFVKRGKPTRYQILQEKQEGGTVLHTNNAFRGRISVVDLGCS
jgi:hypothetical protein